MGQTYFSTKPKNKSVPIFPLTTPCGSARVVRCVDRKWLFTLFAIERTLNAHDSTPGRAGHASSRCGSEACLADAVRGADDRRSEASADLDPAGLSLAPGTARALTIGIGAGGDSPSPAFERAK